MWMTSYIVFEYGVWACRWNASNENQGELLELKNILEVFVNQPSKFESLDKVSSAGKLLNVRRSVHSFKFVCLKLNGNGNGNAQDSTENEQQLGIWNAVLLVSLVSPGLGSQEAGPRREPRGTWLGLWNLFNVKLLHRTTQRPNTQVVSATYCAAVGCNLFKVEMSLHDFPAVALKLHSFHLCRPLWQSVLCCWGGAPGGGSPEEKQWGLRVDMGTARFQLHPITTAFPHTQKEVSMSTPAEETLQGASCEFSWAVDIYETQNERKRLCTRKRLVFCEWILIPQEKTSAKDSPLVTVLGSWLMWLTTWDATWNKCSNKTTTGPKKLHFVFVWKYLPHRVFDLEIQRTRRVYKKFWTHTQFVGTCNLSTHVV